MVLTRADRNRLLSAGIEESIVANMQSVPRTVGGTVVPTTAPVMTGSVPAVVNTSATVAPAVEQFIAMVRSSNRSLDSYVSDTSITSPEYSSVTARNVQLEFRQNAPTQQQPQESNGRSSEDVVGLLRSEFSRQMDEFRRSMRQEIAHALSQAPSNQHNTPAGSVPPVTPGRQSIQAVGNGIPGEIDRVLPDLPHRTFQPREAPTYSVGRPQFLQGLGQDSSLFGCPSDYAPSLNRVDLSKWGIKFDGTAKSMSAEDFIFRVDVLRQDYNCTFNDVLRSFHLLLEGQALDWYWNVRKLTPIRNWQELESVFLTQYPRFESEFQIQKKIMDRRQLPQESFEDFFNAVIRLRNQQRNPYSESDLVEIMRLNLKPALSHLLFSLRTGSLSEFCRQAKRAESLVLTQRQQYAHRPITTHRVNEVEYEGDIIPDANPEVEALTSSSSGYTCWNCRQTGHGFMDCPSPTRRIFCFRCGRDGVVTPKCPVCQGNLEKNRSRPGQTRSTQT